MPALIIFNKTAPLIIFAFWLSGFGGWEVATHADGMLENKNICSQEIK